MLIKRGIGHIVSVIDDKELSEEQKQSVKEQAQFDAQTQSITVIEQQKKLEN